MSAKKVADMLALAYEGYEKAKETNNAELKSLARELVIKALSNKEAGAFFGAIQLALGEIEETPFGNDPDIDDNDNGVSDPEDDDQPTDMDEDTPAASPAYEGITDDEDSKEDNNNKPHEEESGLVALAAKNFLRFYK